MFLWLRLPIWRNDAQLATYPAFPFVHPRQSQLTG
jgi:hypothetical protein